MSEINPDAAPPATSVKNERPTVNAGWRRFFKLVGVLSFAVSALPWIGLGVFAFVIPGWDIVVPRLELFHSDMLYELLAFPLDIIALIPPFDEFVYFEGEGPARVRPFVVFLFYFLIGMLANYI